MAFNKGLLASAALGAAMMAISAGGAGAATITDKVTFSATGFTSAYGDSAPTDPVTGAFQISFDPTLTYTDATTGISLTSLNIALDSAISFDYSPTGASADELIVGGLASGAGTIIIAPSTNDFYLHILNFTTAPAFGQLGYSFSPATSGSGEYFYTTTAIGDSVKVTPVTTGVPEPTTWALMMAGLGALGAALRVSRRKSDALAAA